jgi:hypothetical protein
MDGINDFLAYLQGRGANFQPYGAGVKRYGASGRTAPNIGPVADKQGYRERDLQTRAMRNAMLKRMKAKQSGRFMSPEFMNPQGRSY